MIFNAEGSAPSAAPSAGRRDGTQNQDSFFSDNMVGTDADETSEYQLGLMVCTAVLGQ